jgi:hypothetical protein
VGAAVVGEGPGLNPFHMDTPEGRSAVFSCQALHRVPGSDLCLRRHSCGAAANTRCMREEGVHLLNDAHSSPDAVHEQNQACG